MVLCPPARDSLPLQAQDLCQKAIDVYKLFIINDLWMKCEIEGMV
jgi:hypothetical protein